MQLAFGITFFFIWLAFSSTEGAVTHIDPRYGSLAGGTRVTIFGTGFSGDQFSFGDGNEEKGNIVVFVSGSGHTVPCDIHKDGSTETQIMCYTRPGMKQSVWYNLNVVVDGVQETELCVSRPDRCTFQAHYGYTPRVEGFEPNSGKPGDVILTAVGRIYTTRYGSNTDTSTNGVDARITRAYAPQNCELKNGDEFYGLELDSEGSIHGTLMCKPEGTFVGNANFSFMVEAPYGRSFVNTYLYEVSRTNQIYMIQYYTDINGINPSSGSTEGGAVITVTGDFFEDAGPDSTYSSAEVFVGGAPCEDIQVTKDVQLTCRVPAMQTRDYYVGNRGVLVEHWSDPATFTASDHATVYASAIPPTGVVHFDSASFCGQDINMQWTRTTGVFVASNAGDYHFAIYSTNAGWLYVDGTKRANSNNGWGWTQRFTLTKGQRVVLVAIGSPGSNAEACVYLRANFLSTQFTNSMTGNAYNEVQRLSITSTVVLESQTTSFSVTPTTSTINEVQTVCAESGDGNVRLGLYGVFAEPAAFLNPTAVQDSINALPFLAEGESFSVIQDSSSCLVITFNSNRGDIPDFEAVYSDVNISVTETVAGQSDQTVFSFMYNGVPSPLVTYDESDTAVFAENLQSALDTMFGVQCPEKFFGIGTKTLEDFEDGQSGAVTEVVPFCGRHSMRNNRNIFPIPGNSATKMNFNIKKFMCFAIKDLDNTVLWLRFKDRLDNRVSHWTSYETTDTMEYGWHYACVDLLTIFEERFTTRNPGDYFLENARLNSNADNAVPFYTDVIYFGTVATAAIDEDLRELRLGPAYPNAELEFSIESVTVEYNAVGSNYTITMTPHDCGYNFDPLSLDPAQVVSGAMEMTSAPVTAASEPLTGAVRVTFEENESLDIDVTYTDEAIAHTLMTSFGSDVGRMSAVSTTSSTCAERYIDMEFLDRPGDLEMMTLSHEDLTAPVSAAAEIVPGRDGYLKIEPIPGDMIYTKHDQAQVSVFIDGVPTQCANGGSFDCDFTWSAVDTPTVTGISPPTGQETTVLTITGTGFSDTKSDNTVTIGGVPCTVTGATSISLTCTVGSGTLDTYPVRVLVEGKGYAQNTASDFTYTADVTGISPPQATLAGQIELAVQGYGFNDASTVSVGGVDCPVTRRDTPTTLYCTIPPYSDTSVTTNQIVQVAVSISGTELATTQPFTYMYNTAEIQSVVLGSSVDVQGGYTVTVNGVNMGATGALFLGDGEMTVDSRTDTMIVATAPSPSPYGDNVQLYVMYGTEGAILDTTRNIPTIAVSYKVTNVFPTYGSLYGGTQLTLTGEGLGTDRSAVQVKVGETNCEVDSVTNLEILCDIDDTAHVFNVDNLGQTGLGVYYAYSQLLLTVEQGDIVEWTWQTPDFVYDTAHGVYETTSSTSTDLVVGGVNSGQPTRNGRYQWQFRTEGTFYIWSGHVEPTQVLQYRMTVQVVAKSASVEQVRVFILDQEPEYQVSSGVADPVDASGCDLATADISGCTPENLTPVDSLFNFHFTECRTPVVTSVTFTNAKDDIDRSGLSDTEITISGSGMSAFVCSNIVMVGECSCEITTPGTTDEIQCTPSPSCTLPVGTYQEVSLNVNQYGNAIVEIADIENRSIAFFPSVQSISPTKGSTEGGTAVTITGTLINDLESTSVTFGGAPAECSSVNPLVCVSPVSATGDVVVSVNGFPNVCTGTCTFTYEPSITPTIDLVAPTMVSAAATTLVFTGTLFGTDQSAIQLSVGGRTCETITLSSETSIICVINAIPAGSKNVELIIDGIGKADSSVTVQGVAGATLVAPASGSIHGGTNVEITGFGFFGATTVNADGAEICSNVVVNSLTSLTCTTVPHAAGLVSFIVTSNGQAFPSVSFTYAEAETPTIDNVTPSSGSADDTIVIAGTNFGTNIAQDVTVTVGEEDCTNVALSGVADIACTTPALLQGSYPVQVLVAGKGFSNSDKTFTYEVLVTNISPTSGDSNGNQLLTLIGSGFSEDLVASVCNTACSIDSVTPTQIVCITPPSAPGPCTVTVSDGTTSVSAVTQYDYVDGVAPTISSLSPGRGGTGGGTQLTITGTGFDGTTVTVTIDGLDCPVGTLSVTEVVCTTPAHDGSGQVDLVVTVDGLRTLPTTYFYIDVWSSTATWGGNPIPAEGELIVIPEGEVILLDVSTPVFEMILIDGGQLIFDDADITMRSKRILILKGGKLQVGTEEKPFEYKAIIELYGHHRDIELPIYGTKLVGVRHGTLDMHGKVITNTWTRLAATAMPGDSTITVQDDISDWNRGDEILIATTGDKFSTNENEKHVIADIDSGTKRITLQSALGFKHLGAQETFSGVNEEEVMFEFRAEVGLLTRNVVVRGNRDEQWDRDIEPCPDGFNPGEFVTQTCFEGRFGEEKGSSQFGAQIIVHQAEKDTQIAQAHISYTEVTFAGQAFRLGRYPIHFHLNGDMSKSYVKGSAIHETFNRAINIHGSHNIMIEKNVAYNVMGGAFFLEDGVETNNTYDGNLGVFVRASSSLLNDDITPATFWATNPDNTYINNAAAGGTHFGWWFRMHEHPDGPSFDSNICPRRVPLRKFQHNSAHSFGWFGIWMFQEYYPVAEGACNGRTEAVPAVFEDFISWNNEKGVEFVTYGSLQIIRGIFVQNALAGFEGKRIKNGPRRDNFLSAMVNDTLIVGKSLLPEVQNSQGTTAAGIILPYDESFQIHNTKFLNFPSTTEDPSVALKWTEIDGVCKDRCGGYSYQVSQLQFDNVDEQLWFRWGHEAVVEDIDGSLCGTADSKILPDWGNSIPDGCTTCTGSYRTSGIAPAVCSGTEVFHRFSFNNIAPSSLKGKNISIENSYGSSIGEYRFKRLTHKNGWMVILLDGETYTITWDNADEMTNVSFSGVLNEFQTGDCVIFRLKVNQEPDVTSLDNGKTWKNQSETAIDCTTVDISTGDWYYDNEGYVRIAFTGPSGGRRKRAVVRNDISVNVRVQKCFFEGCIPPPDEEDRPPSAFRPDPFFYWNDNIWTTADGVSTASAAGTEPPPAPDSGNDIVIASDIWVVIKDAISLQLGTVEVEGGLEIAYETTSDYTLTADFIIINGGKFVVGWPDSPILGTATIILTGSVDSPLYTKLDGYVIGNKAIGVFGGLELHGRDVGPSWLKLAETAAANSLVIKVDGDISQWKTGDEIIITSTSFSPSETERRTISSVNSGTGKITLDTALMYRHQASMEIVDGESIFLGGVVGHLTRSIVIEGEVVPGEAHGGRVMASITQVGETVRTGYIRANYAQFKHMGQDGYTETYDPRYAMSFIATGDVREAKPSIVNGCSFVDLFSSAVGAYGIGGLHIENNVVYKPLGNGIVTTSDDTVIYNNLVSNVQWTGAYDGRDEQFNFRYEAGIEAIGSSGLNLTNNYVSNSERSGYRVPGFDCVADSSLYANNYAVGNLMGVAIFPKDNIQVSDTQTCSRFSGFNAMKNRDYGIYYNNINSVILSNNIFSDNTLAAFPMVIKPNPLSLECSDKFVEFTDSIVIGMSTDAMCTGETQPSGTYFSRSDQCRGPQGPNNEALGVLFPQFTGGSNNAPDKPCGNIMSYNTICGRMYLTNTKLVNFGPSQNGCPASFAVSVHPWNDDLQHYIKATGNSLFNVDPDYTIVIPRPRVGKINPADCVDMDCDAMKKALFVDMDGSILGSAGAVIPESEWEWGGDARRGLNDGRVPKDMLTLSSGQVMTVDELAPNGRGIYRSASCSYVSGSKYGFYNCPATEYRLLTIQSLDDDTETRRLSPVAILQDGFIDLINGPQDHGWCNGYTCQERISLFHALVTTGKMVTIFTTSSQPDVTRFMLLDSSESDCVVVAFYFTTLNRIDVFTDLVADVNVPAVKVMPTCNDAHGTNYFDRQERLVYFVVKGGGEITLARASVITMSLGMPTMTVDEFFGDKVVQNLANYLQISLNMVRVISIIQENVGGRRRRDDSDEMEVILEIGDGPQFKNSPVMKKRMEDLLLKLTTSCQDGSMAHFLKTDQIECNFVSYGDQTYTFEAAAVLQFVTEPLPAYEGAPFNQQPWIRVVNDQGNPITDLGTPPWVMTATLRAGTGDSGAVLTGTTAVSSTNGLFMYNDLGITLPASGYIIDFEITSPSDATGFGFSIASASLDVDNIPLTVVLHEISEPVTQDTVFSMTLEMQNTVTGSAVADLDWRGHQFEATCSSSSKKGQLSGTLTRSFDEDTKRAVFDDLEFSGFGFVYVTCNVVSTPAEYDFDVQFQLSVLSQKQKKIKQERKSEIAVRYDVDYDKEITSPAKKAQLHEETLDHFTKKYPDVIVTKSTIRRGSIIVTFTIVGENTTVTMVTANFCQDLTAGQTITFGNSTLTMDSYMMVNGQNVYGECSKIDTEEERTLHPGYIALITAMAVLVACVVIFILFWKLKLQPNKNVQPIQVMPVQHIGHSNAVTLTESQAYKMNYPKSMDQRRTSGFHAESSVPITTLYDETAGYGNLRRPSPIADEDRILPKKIIKPARWH